MAPMPSEHRKPRGPVDQIETGMAFYAGLGMDVSHFGPMWHILKVGQLMMTDLNRISGQHGMSFADFHLLGALMMVDPEALRATDLALALNVSNAVLSGRVRKLAADGLLSRSTPPEDRRATMLHLTPQGADKVKAIGGALERDGQFVRHYRHLAPADRAALGRIMGDLHMAMDRDFLPAPRSKA